MTRVDSLLAELQSRHRNEPRICVPRLHAVTEHGTRDGP
jgi:hypothetical protein